MHRIELAANNVLAASGLLKCCMCGSLDVFPQIEDKADRLFCESCRVAIVAKGLRRKLKKKRAEEMGL